MLSENGLCLVPNLDGINIQLQTGHATQVQFSSPFGDMVETFKIDRGGNLLPGKKIETDTYLVRIDELCARHGCALNVRFFGFYSDVFDAQILEHLPNIRSLTVNCLHDAIHLETIGSLKGLEDLSFGVFDLQEKDILNHFPLEKLKSLTLEETNTKALDLAPLAKGHALRLLRLFGHKKNIETLSALNKLHEFIFNPAKGISIEFINSMTELRILKFVLGGCEDFNEVRLPYLKDLALTQVRGLTTLGDLSRFPKLERLLIEDQIQLQPVTFNAKSKALKHVSFVNCKVLDALPGLNTLPNLESVTAFGTGISIDKMKLPKSLTHASVHSGRVKDKRTENASIVARGLVLENHPDASFFYK